MTFIPQVTRDIVGKGVIQEIAPLVDKSTREQVGSVQVSKKVDVYDNKPIPIGFAKAVESVPSTLLPLVRRVCLAALKDGVHVSEIYVKREIESYLEKSLNDLRSESNYHKMWYLAGQWQALSRLGFKLNDPKIKEKVDEWQALVKKQRETDETFENFAISLIMNGFKDEEILEQSKTNDAASRWWSEGLTLGDGEAVALIQIEKLRRRLHPEEAKILYGESKGNTEDAEALGQLLKVDAQTAKPLQKTIGVEHAALGFNAAKKLIKNRQKREVYDQVKDQLTLEQRMQYEREQGGD